MSTTTNMADRVAPRRYSEVTRAHQDVPGSTPPLLFAVFQTGRLANGGVESITAVIEGLPLWRRLVVTNRETPVCDRWRASGAEVVVWDLPYEMGSSLRKSGLLGRLRRGVSLVKTNLLTILWALCQRMSIIHCNDPAPFWHLAPAAKLLGIPLVFNLRDTKSADEGLDVAAYRRRFRFASRVLVISCEMKGFYARVFQTGEASKQKISNIYSSVDYERMRPLASQERADLRKRLGIAKETFAIGFIATFNDKKNQLGYLRSAVPAMRGIMPAARTYFVGDFDSARDAYARECRQTVTDMQAEDATFFAGYTAAVEEWYQACDVLVVPTRKEGLARCMIEGLACGTPVVSFDVCSAREILEPDNCGVVVKSGDYAGLVEALRGLERDTARLLEMRRRAVATARRLFTGERMIAEYKALYKSLERSR